MYTFILFAHDYTEHVPIPRHVYSLGQSILLNLKEGFLQKLLYILDT